MEPLRLAAVLLDVAVRFLRRGGGRSPDDRLVAEMWETVRARLRDAGVSPFTLDALAEGDPAARSLVERTLAGCWATICVSPTGSLGSCGASHRTAR